MNGFFTVSSASHGNWCNLWPLLPCFFTPPNYMTDVCSRCWMDNALWKPWKRLDGSELDGSEHFEKNCPNVPGGAGAAVGAAAGAAASVCIYYVIMGGRFAPPYKYMIKCIQQKQ